MAVVRGLAVAPDMGGQRCYAVEIAFDSGEDYALAMIARVVNDECQQPPIAFEQGSGICDWHLRQIKERRRSIP
jgi:hypothetical protein